MWLIYKSSGSEKKQKAATRSIPEETEATLETADLDGVSSGACVVVDGVDGRGIKRMLNEFKEDYKLGDRFHLFSLKVYAQDSRRHLVVFEGGYKFEDFYDLLLTMYLNLNKGQDAYGYSSTFELKGVDEGYALFRFMDLEGNLSCVVCGESGRNYRETRNPKKKLVYDYESAEGLCRYIYQSEYRGNLLMELEISGPKPSEKYSCLFTLLKFVAGFAIAVPVMRFGFKAEVSRDSMLILVGMSVLCGILYGAIYHFRNPDQGIQKVKNRVGITFSIVFFGALVIIRFAQIINA